MDAAIDASAQAYQVVKKAVPTFHRIAVTTGRFSCGRVLIGHDLSIPQEREKVQEHGLFTPTCGKCIRDSVELFEEVL